MNILLLILSILFVMLFVIRQIVRYKRFVLINNLNKYYTQIELFFVKKQIELTNEHIQFLKIFKNLTVNSDYLDLQVLFVCKITLEKKGVDLKKDKLFFEKMMNSLGDEFKEIFDEFDKTANSIIKLSMLKPDFVMFALKIIVISIIKSGFSSFNKVNKDFQYIQNNEEVIAYSGYKLA